MSGEEPLITAAEVARRLGVTDSAVRQWVRNGQVTPAVVTPGGRYRFIWSNVVRDLEEWQRRQQERDE